jgi:hypothetical protein
MAEENIMTKQSVGWLEMVNYTGDPLPGGKSTRRGLAFINGSLYYWSGTDFVALSAGNGGIADWDSLYDLDKTLTLDDGVLTFTVTTAANGLYINKTNAGAGVPLVIANSGSGYDIQGPAWSIISTGSVGILELTSGGTINATGGALTIGKTATATTFAGTVTINEGLSTADGAVTFTDNSNAAASVSVVNATATTYAGVMKVTAAALTSGTGILATFAELTTGTGLSIVAAKTTTGTLLKLTATEATLSTGKYIQCYDGAADDFSVARYGAITIGGLAANNMITITTGDVLFSDGSLTIVDADNAATVSVTNNTATSASVFVLAGSGTFTGSTTTSFVTITPSGLTSGTAVYLPVAALTSGVAVSVVGNALTTGQLVSLASSATAITGAGRLFLSTHSGATSTSGTLNEFISAATDETVILQVKASGALALGKIVNLSGASVTTGSGLVIGDLDALTTGIGISVASAATAITGAGRLLSVAHTGTTGTSATLVEFITAATDETVVLQVKASAALAAGKLVNVSGASMTTGTAIAASDLNALTSGIGIHVASSATAITGAGRLIYSNHTGATGTSATLNEFATAATDETILFALTATGALALGTVVSIVADSCTTGFGINISMDALTSGVVINVHSDSADVSARDLVHIHNDNVAAVGTIPLQIVNDAVTGTGSKFKAAAKFCGFTLWVSTDGTTPNGNLTGTAGDICLNASSSKPLICTGTTNWSAVA